MQRAVTYVLVICSSLMLGKAPCCRIHEYSTPIHRALEAGAGDREARGPGDFICPCCGKPQNKDGKPVRTVTTRCTCPPLIATIGGNADAVDLPPDTFAALPFHTVPQWTGIVAGWSGPMPDARHGPPAAFAALALPLLL